MTSRLEEKRWIYKNHTCYVTFHNMGHRCGYVELTSPLFNLVEYQRTEFSIEDITPTTHLIAPLQHAFNNLQVHGGVTYCQDGYIGFNCQHYNDAPDLEQLRIYKAQGLTPNKSRIEWRSSTIGTIRTLDFCIFECESLVDQLEAIHSRFSRLITDYPELFL